MKKLTTLLLCMALMLGLCTLAFASESGDVNVVFGEVVAGMHTHSVVSIAATGDTVYALVLGQDTGELSLWKWKHGMQDPEELESVELTWQESNATHIFSHAGSVYAFDGESLSVRQLVDANGNLTPTDILNQLQVEVNTYMDSGIAKIFAQDGKLYLSGYTYTMQSVTTYLEVYELATGKWLEMISQQNMMDVYPYQAGKLLMLRFDANQEPLMGEPVPPFELLVYDMATHTLDKIADTHNYGDGGLVYSEERNTIYFVSGSSIYSYPQCKPPYQLSAYLPERAYDFSLCTLLDGKYYVHAYDNLLFVRELDQAGLEAGALSIVGRQLTDTHMAVVRDHPELALKIEQQAYPDVSAISSAMIGGEDLIDIITIATDDYDTLDVNRVIDKGYALELSGYPEIMGQIAKMDTAITAPLMREGKLYGIPAFVNASTITILPDAMAELGITQETTPKTQLEFLEFLANYQADYGDDHPDIKLFDNTHVKNGVFGNLLTRYVQEQMRAGDAVRFDTPLFRKLLAAFEQIDFAEFDPYEVYGDDLWNQEAIMSDFYAKPSLIQQYFYYNSPQEIEGEGYCFISILPLDAGMQPLAALELAVMIINPRSKRIDQSVLYLSEYMKNYDLYTAFTLFPDHNEPVVAPDYEARVKQCEDSIAKLQNQLAIAAPENKASIEAELQTQTAELAMNDNWKMLVSTEQINAFRTMVSPYFYVAPLSPLVSNADAINSIRKQYLQKIIDADAFIKELDQRMVMIQLED